MQQYNRLSADVPHLLSLARARLTPLKMASGEYEQGSKGRRELPKLQRTSQSTDVRRSCARANSWRVRVVATPKRTEIEGETLLQVIRELRASKPSGGWSEIASCVREEETV